MKTSSYRIYLTPNRLGRLQQIRRVTRDFYDITPAQYRDGDGTRWYKISGTSPGCAFTALWKAAPAGHTGPAAINGLGARMRLFSNQWYVDCRDIDLAQAACLDHMVLTWPKALTLAMALIVFAYLLAMTAYSSWTGLSIPAIQPLARFSALAMVLMLLVEYLLGRIQKWMQESLGVW